MFFFFLMIRRPPRSTLDRSSAASDVYKRQGPGRSTGESRKADGGIIPHLSLIHISEPTRQAEISYAVFCLKKKKKKNREDKHNNTEKTKKKKNNKKKVTTKKN